MKHFSTDRIIVAGPVALGRRRGCAEWYDLTEVYLRNANFSENISYTTEDNLDVRNKLNDIAGWKLDEASAETTPW